MAGMYVLCELVAVLGSSLHCQIRKETDRKSQLRILSPVFECLAHGFSTGECLLPFVCACVFACVRQMQKEGHRPDVACCNAVLRSLGAGGQEVVERVHTSQDPTPPQTPRPAPYCGGKMKSSGLFSRVGHSGNQARICRAGWGETCKEKNIPNSQPLNWEPQQ